VSCARVPILAMVDDPDLSDRRRYRVSGSFSIRVRREQARCSSHWYETYIGSSGVIFLGFAAYAVYRVDFRFAILSALAGLGAIAYAIRFVRRRGDGDSEAS
jgi:hypothetical protein